MNRSTVTLIMLGLLSASPCAAMGSTSVANPTEPISSNARAAEVTVSTVGQLHTALRSANPGDTIIMTEGTWNNASIVFDGRNSANGQGGIEGSPITLRAQEAGETILSGQSTLRIAGAYMVVDGLLFTNGFSTGTDVVQFRNGTSNLASNSRMTNCAMIDFNPPNASTNYKWVSVYGLNNRVDRCWFEGMNHIGVQLTVWLNNAAPPNNTRIDQNYFGYRAQASENGFETIRIGTSDTSENLSAAIVEDNYFEYLDGEIEIISSKSCGNIYRRNTFLSSKGQLTLRHGRDCIVDGNFFIGNGISETSGVRIVGPGHQVTNNYFEGLNGTSTRAALSIMNGVPNSPLNRYLQAEDCLVAFNTFVNCREVFAIGVTSSEGDTTLAPRAITLANNLAVSPNFNMIRQVTPIIDPVYEGNILFGTPGISPVPPGIDTTTNPQLALAPDGLTRPQIGSPAINGAVGFYPAIATDIDGQPRADPKDVGADEVSEAPITTGLLTAADVGPLWKRPLQQAQAEIFQVY